MKFLTLDPGLEGTGLALWRAERNYKDNRGGWFRSENYELLKCLNLTSRCGSWWDRGLDLCHQLDRVLEEENPLMCFLEEPSYFDGQKGQMVARRGDLVKLCTVYGMLYRTCDRNGGHEVVSVSIMRWKGQLPKHLVERRVRSRLRLETRKYTSHEIDAIGIGLHVMGVI